MHGSYPDSYTKTDKVALRKRSNFFSCKGADLFNVGGSGSKYIYVIYITWLRGVYQQYQT